MGVRPLATAIAAIGILAGCSSCASGGTTTDPAGHNSLPTAPPVSARPPATEPPVSVAKLQSILLGPSDLPVGFAPGTENGDELVAVRACNRRIIDTTGVKGEVREVLTRGGDHLRLVELVDGFSGSAAASAPLAALRALSQSCRQSGVSSLQPPAVGEEVAGLQLAGPAGPIQVAMIRSGPIVTVVVLAGPQPIAATTTRAVVQAAGTKLAVGTGG